MPNRKKLFIRGIDQKYLKVINTIKLPVGDAYQMALVYE